MCCPEVTPSFLMSLFKGEYELVSANQKRGPELPIEQIFFCRLTIGWDGRRSPSAFTVTLTLLGGCLGEGSLR